MNTLVTIVLFIVITSLRQSKVTCYSLSEQGLFYVSNRHMVCQYSSFFENGLKKILGLFAANIAGTNIGNGCAPDIVAYPNGKSTTPIDRMKGLP